MIDKYEGTFFPQELDASGQIRLETNDVSYTMLGPFWDLLCRPEIDLFGELPSGEKVSLLRSVVTDCRRHIRDDERSVELDFWPEFAVVGERYVSSRQKVIQSISYTFGDACLLNQYTSNFRVIRPIRDHLSEFVEKSQSAHPYREQYSILGPKGLGENPLVALFDGQEELARSKPTGLEISIRNRLISDLGSPSGVRMQNEVHQTIRFDHPATLRSARSHLQQLHQFNELILGRRQQYGQVRLSVSDGPDATEEFLWVHLNGCNTNNTKNQDQHRGMDLPIYLSQDQKVFEKILENWMNSATEMMPARLRYFDNFNAQEYSYDRLIGAANMFDLLPAGRIPLGEEVAPSLDQAVQTARRAFQALEQSPARDSILSALGRTGKPSLRGKINHCAEIVNQSLDKKLADIEHVCREAVICRNHYVHGSEASFNYEEEFGLFVFLTDTLEFLFSASDLVNCGWNAGEYQSRRKTQSHFFSRYLATYGQNLRALQRCLDAEQAQ